MSGELGTLRVAATTMSARPATSFDDHARHVRRLLDAAAGAELVVLPEMCSIELFSLEPGWRDAEVSAVAGRVRGARRRAADPRRAAARGRGRAVFIPGHTVETFPEVCRRIVEEGHEVGHHGWMHESPLSLDAAAERDVLERSIDAIERVLGVRPLGYRSPS